MLGKIPQKQQIIQQQQQQQDQQDNGQQINQNINQIQNALQEVDPQNLSPAFMYLSVQGVIESGYCEDEQTLQVQYSIYKGEDWEIKDPQNQPGDKTTDEISGISQKSSSYSLYVRDIVFNFPFECTFSTTKAYGWPQLILTLKGPDIFGRNVIKGYGSVHFPTQPGTHERTVRIYKPIPMSKFSGFFGYIFQEGAAKYQSKVDTVIGKGEGRDVTRVKAVGSVKVKFEVMKRNFQLFGYSY